MIKLLFVQTSLNPYRHHCRHIYRKWNGRLFEEMYKAYAEGRGERNPAEFWYKGEIGFFEHYIIPLAKKLKNCGVFGVSSDEYLNYAESNLKEWEARGQVVVGELVEHVRKTYEDDIYQAYSQTQHVTNTEIIIYQS